MFKNTLLVIALLSASSAFANTNLITDGNFLLSNISSGSYGYENGFSGSIPTDANWMFSTTGATGVINGAGIWGLTGSVPVAFLQSFSGFTGAPTIAQTFSSASNAFTVSFDMANRNGGSGTESVNVMIDGQTVVGSLAAQGNFTQYTYNVSGLTGTSHTLSFTGVNPTSGDSTLFLNNVSVSAVPEPTEGALMLSGMGLLGFIASRRKKSA